MTSQSTPSKDGRTLAQFFFEVGYGACWADAYIKNNETPPFELTDAAVEQAWAIAPEAHDDAAEFDRQQALADSAPALVEAMKDIDRHVSHGKAGDWSIALDEIRKIARAALNLTKEK